MARLKDILPHPYLHPQKRIVQEGQRVSDMPCSVMLGQRRVWVLVFVWVLGGKVSKCNSPGCPETLSAEQAGFKLRHSRLFLPNDGTKGV